MAASSSSYSADVASSSRSYEYDVFLSFRGQDVRKGFLDHFYTALLGRQIRTYKDDKTLPKGETIDLSLMKAIEESRMAVIIFSKNYADSAWCLDELVHIMKCRKERGLMVVPVFYDVEISDVRHQRNEFGEAFAKEKPESLTKAKIWREALVEICTISGWELSKTADGHESQFINEIINTTISDGLFKSNLDVDENLIGMSARLKELELLLDIWSSGVLMVGIWGVGGSGKTTLATSLKMQISKYFHAHCTLENVREETSKYGLKHLQEKLLSNLLGNKEIGVQSVEEGKSLLKSMLCHRKVLLVLDDINTLGQLEALAGMHSWFGSGSRIIITTRDQQLLRTHKVNEIYRSRLLSHNEAIQLFRKHAYNEDDLLEDYDTLSSSVISYSAGLPLALKVLGSFLFDKNKDEWISTLEKLKHIPDLEVTDILKISYDGLESYQKELFLDIACFWRYQKQEEAVVVLEACGYYPSIGLKVLVQKALISIDVDRGFFDMHDLVQEMGHYIVRGKHPNNPEKHSRVWKQEDIDYLFSNFEDATMENNKIEGIVFNFFDGAISTRRLYRSISNLMKLRWFRIKGEGANVIEQHFQDLKFLPNTKSHPKIVSKMLEFSRRSLPSHRPKRKTQKGLLRWLCGSNKQEKMVNEEEMVNDYDYDEGPIRLSNELRYIEWEMDYVRNLLPHTFQPRNLVVLKLLKSYQEELWKGCKHLPHLKELNLQYMWELVKTPEFDAPLSLQTLILYYCDKLVEIHSSLGNCTGLVYVDISYCPILRIFPTFVNMKNLKILRISKCFLSDRSIPSGIGALYNLQELVLESNSFSRLDFSLSKLIKLKLLDLSYCNYLSELPELPSGLAILIADRCNSLTTIGDSCRSCEWLCEVSFEFGSVINDGGRLLQSMLKGKAIEYGSMLLTLEGHEILKTFTPPMVKGRRYRLELQEEWRNDFSGFLICLTFSGYSNSWAPHFSVRISESEVMSGISSDDAVVWEVDDDGNADGLRTLLGYIPFGSLRGTSWWDQPHISLLFEILDLGYVNCGVTLVGKRSKNDVTETLTTYTSSPYTPTLKIEHDSPSAITISLRQYYKPWRYSRRRNSLGI